MYDIYSIDIFFKRVGVCGKSDSKSTLI